MLLNRDYDNDMHTVQTRKKTVIPTMVDKRLIWTLLKIWIKLSY